MAIELPDQHEGSRSRDVPHPVAISLRVDVRCRRRQTNITLRLSLDETRNKVGRVEPEESEVRRLQYVLAVINRRQRGSDADDAGSSYRYILSESHRRPDNQNGDG